MFVPAELGIRQCQTVPGSACLIDGASCAVYPGAFTHGKNVYRGGASALFIAFCDDA